MADALASGASVRKNVGVQVPPRAQMLEPRFGGARFFVVRGSRLAGYREHIGGFRVVSYRFPGYMLVLAGSPPLGSGQDAGAAPLP